MDSKYQGLGSYFWARGLLYALQVPAHRLPLYFVSPPSRLEVRKSRCIEEVREPYLLLWELFILLISFSMPPNYCSGK